MDVIDWPNDFVLVGFILYMLKNLNIVVLHHKEDFITRYKECIVTTTSSLVEFFMGEKWYTSNINAKELCFASVDDNFTYLLQFVAS